MKSTRLYIIYVLIFCFTNMFAQHGPPLPGSLLSGRTADAVSKTGLEYANVVLYTQTDSLQIDGAVTGADGEFTLRINKPGNYFLEVFYVGFGTKRINDIVVAPGQERVQLGDIPLDAIAISADEVRVEGERSPVSFQIDKKVINVSSQYTATSGNAADVLANVPSVTVDIDGNVSLRGSQSFRVLIDGVPSTLEPSEALQQIPASTIENIEIITNPSAKYAPDGNSGIINVIVKKGELAGTNGVVNLDGGLEDKYGGDFLLNFRDGKYQLNIGGDYKKDFNPGRSIAENRTVEDGVTSYIQSVGTTIRGRESMGLRAGASFNFSASDFMNLTANLGDRSFGWDSALDYDQYTDPGTNRLLFLSENSFSRSGVFYALSMDYKHAFPKKGHEVTAQMVFNHRDADEENANRLFSQGDFLTSGQIATENDPSDNYEARLDYVLPLNKKDRFEAGAQTRIRLTDEVTTLSLYDTVQASYILDPGSTRHSQYDDNIHSLYTLYAMERGKAGFQGGLRAEYTGRTIGVIEENAEFRIDRWDYFPTAHFSYAFSGGQSFMASYTRRIDRPRGWYLEPFETWTDAYNVRRGNPALQPENVDSYEAGYQTFLGENVISSELYYRVSHNKIERLKSVYDENITLQTFANVGTDYSLGAEFMLSSTPLAWWNVNYMANLYNYRVEGALDDLSFNRESFNWSLRLNNTFKLGKDTRFQINGMYKSPTVSAQGEQEGFLTFDAALRHEIIRKVLSATLQVQDAFGTERRESFSEGAGFYNYDYYDQNSPVVMLNLNFLLNNYRPEKERRPAGNGGGDGGEF